MPTSLPEPAYDPTMDEPLSNPDVQSPDDLVDQPDQSSESDSADDTLSELERSDIDDVVSVRPEPGEEDDLSELERTDLDDVLSMKDPDEKPRPKRVRKVMMQRTARPYYPPTIGMQGIQ